MAFNTQRKVIPCPRVLGIKSVSLKAMLTHMAIHSIGAEPSCVAYKVGFLSIFHKLWETCTDRIPCPHRLFASSVGGAPPAALNGVYLVVAETKITLFTDALTVQSGTVLWDCRWYKPWTIQQARNAHNLHVRHFLQQETSFHVTLSRRKGSQSGCHIHTDVGERNT